MTVEVWTDGALDNQLNGGWAWVTKDGRQDSGGVRNTTNNRMELLAVARAISSLADGMPLCVVTDSAYVANCFTDLWYLTWRKRGWRNSKGEPVQNRDLWEPLITAALANGVTFRHVRGHSGDPMNERADQLAVAARLKLKEQSCPS